MPPHFCSSKTGLAESNAFDKSLQDPSSSALATKGVVWRSSGSFDGRTSCIPWAVEPCGSFSCQGSFTGARSCFVFRHEDYQVTCLQGSIFVGGCEVHHKDPRWFTACVYQEKWSRLLHWSREWNIASCKPCKATVSQIAKFFLHLC